MVPLELREDQAIPAEERWADIDFAELSKSQPNKQQMVKEYTVEDKIQVVTLYFMCGSMKQVQKDTGISFKTINTKGGIQWDSIQNCS